MQNKPTIEYPYLPPEREILFVSPDNPWIQAAKKMADEHSGCSWWPTGAVIVKNNQIIGQGANSGNFQPVCPRVEQECKTGEGYHFCHDLCQQDGHSEITSVNDALANNNDPQGADLYLFGHWWCCEPCWNHMITHGIQNVYLLENAHLIFIREKRLELMKELARKKSNGEKINCEHAVWTLD